MNNHIKIQQLNPETFEYQDYKFEDKNLLTKNPLTTQFISSSDYIEFFVFDENNQKIYPDYIDVLSDYIVKNNEILLNPSQNLQDLGFDTEVYNVLYNFYRKRLSSSPETQFFIKEISSDRTEIRLDSNIIDSKELEDKTNEFITYRDNSEYFVDFLLNFGENKTVIANNIKLDQDSGDTTVLIKLYNPLPNEFQLKTKLWVVEKISNPQSYKVEFPFTPDVEQDFEYISGPNFSINVQNQNINTTPELSYDTLVNTSSLSINSEIKNTLKNKGVDVNINYEDFNDFIHFSSAKTRLENFIYKVQLLENLDQELSNLSSSISSPGIIYNSQSIALNNQKESILNNFDGYESFLYYQSGSDFTYPKQTSTQPYELYSSNSTQATNWIDNISQQAELYDIKNQNQLKYTIPEYLREDPNNRKYDLFIDMIGQHYDNIWVYTRKIQNRFSGDNRLNYGISKDLVKEAIEDFGVKLYSNSFNLDDLYNSFLGINLENNLPFVNMTGDYPVNNGQEYVDNYITSQSSYNPLNKISKRIYKRIYHNIPYMLKTKGTLNGLRALITSYGIPYNILTIKGEALPQINIQDNTLVTSSLSDNQPNTLSPYRQIQTPYSSSNRTKDLEVGFSLQDKLNQDIYDQLGELDLNMLIGDPRDINNSSRSYPKLDQLRDSFFNSYLKIREVKDFVRIIKFFDNSLFKIIKDFVPANTSLSTGVIVKQHNLERNKQRPPQVSWDDKTYETQVRSFPFNYEKTTLEKYQGQTGGIFDKFNNISTSPFASVLGLSNRFNLTQSYQEEFNTTLGNIIETQSSQEEFYNGEFSGSVLEITDQNLNPCCDPYKKSPNNPIFYKPFIFNKNINTTDGGTVTPLGWSDQFNSPFNGEIWFLTKRISTLNIVSNSQSKFSFLPGNINNEYEVFRVKMAKIDNNGVNLTSYLSNGLERIEFNFLNKKLILFVDSINIYSEYVELIIDISKGQIKLTDNNLRYNNGLVDYPNDTIEKGSKNYFVRANGNYTNYNPNSPEKSQGKFLGNNIGGVTQFFQYYNGDGSIIANPEEYHNFNTGSLDFINSQSIGNESTTTGLYHGEKDTYFFYEAASKNILTIGGDSSGPNNSSISLTSNDINLEDKYFKTTFPTPSFNTIDGETYTTNTIYGHPLLKQGGLTSGEIEVNTIWLKLHSVYDNDESSDVDDWTPTNNFSIFGNKIGELKVRIMYKDSPSSNPQEVISTPKQDVYVTNDQPFSITFNEILNFSDYTTSEGGMFYVEYLLEKVNSEIPSNKGVKLVSALNPSSTSEVEFNITHNIIEINSGLSIPEYGEYVIKQTPNVPLNFNLKVDYNTLGLGFTSPSFDGLYHFRTKVTSITGNTFSLSNSNPDFNFIPSGFPNSFFNGGLDPQVFDTQNITLSQGVINYNPGTSNNSKPLLLQSGSADLKFVPEGLKYSINYQPPNDWIPFSGSSLLGTNSDITGSINSTYEDVFLYNNGDKDGLFIFEFRDAYDSGNTFPLWDKQDNFELIVVMDVVKKPGSTENSQYTIFTTTGDQRDFFGNTNIPSESDYNFPLGVSAFDQNNNQISPNVDILEESNPVTFVFDQDYLKNQTDSTTNKDIFIKPMINNNYTLNYNILKYKSYFSYKKETITPSQGGADTDGNPGTGIDEDGNDVIIQG